MNRKASKDAAVEEIIKLLHFAERCNSSARLSFLARGTRSRVSHVLEQTQRRAELDEPSVLSDRRLPSRKIAKSFIAEPRKRKVFPGKLSRRHPSLSVLTHPPDHLEFSSFSLLKNPRERVNRASILKVDGHRKETRDNSSRRSFVRKRKKLENTFPFVCRALANC